MRKAIAVLVAAALLTGLGAASALAAPSGTTPVYYTYWSAPWHAQIRPSGIYWGAGGSLFTEPLKWRRWTGTSAYARGTLWVDNCRPNCSRGHLSKYPDSVTLWRVRDHGRQQYYTRLTLRHWKKGRNLCRIYELGGDGPAVAALAATG